MLGKREPHSVSASISKTRLSHTLTDQRTRASASTAHTGAMRSLQAVAPVDHHPGTDVLRDFKRQPDTLPKRSFIGFDQKIVAMYAQGMSERAIHHLLSSMYGPEVSPSYINKVMDAMTIEVATWQNRPLASLYPLIFLDVLRVIVCDGSTIHHKSACLAWGILPEGTREFLGVWIGQTGARLWPKMLSEFRARGVSDVLIAVVDGLQGTLEAKEISGAISMILPVTMVQTAILQLVRHSLEQASHSDRKAVADALRPIYTAQTIQAARDALGEFSKGAFGVRYPTIVHRWQQSWENITPFLMLPPEVRRLIHATAVIENLRARVRRVIKARGHFAGDDAVRKQLWLTLRNSTTHRVRSKSEWKAATNQFVALYGDRFINPS